jgi:hypothetical protein
MAARTSTCADSGEASLRRRLPAGGPQPWEEKKVRTTFNAASASLVAAVLFSACGGAPSSSVASPAPGSCSGVAGKHHAELVIQHGDGRVLDRCAGFDQDQVKGDALMKNSGVQYQSQVFSFGLAVCQIDREPDRFSQCLPTGAPYWALWISTAGGSWTMAQTSVSEVTIKPGEALGWRYTPASESSPSPPPSPHGAR